MIIFVGIDVIPDMKKIVLLAATLMLAFSCAQNKAPKILVLYYSQNGGTETIAQAIAGSLGADMEAIVPVNPYDGTYQETIARCLQEREAGTVPEIQPIKADIQAYDVIFIGYPIWFGTFAPPMAGLLNTVDFSGKTLVPFCSFGSGGLDSSIKDLEEKQPQAKVLPGYGVRAARIDAVPQEVDRFLKENGFLEGEYEKYEAFSDFRPAEEAESAIFDAAVGDYPMIHAKAKNVASRAVTNGTEYLFEAEDIPMPGQPSRTIKVYVLDLENENPVFTQVIR